MPIQVYEIHTLSPRWFYAGRSGEMKEIALTMEGIGLTPGAFDGAACMYELVDAVFHQKGYSEGPPMLTGSPVTLPDHQK